MIHLITCPVQTCLLNLFCLPRPQPDGDSTEKAVVLKAVPETLAGNDSTKSAGEPPKEGAKPKPEEQLETNEIPQDKGTQP